jgi:DNA replication protein
MDQKPPQPFRGFPAGKSGSVRVPNLFFSELLPLIDDLAELKVTTYCFWAIQQREGHYRYVRLADMLEDDLLLRGLAEDRTEAVRVLRAALQRAVTRGTLLHTLIDGGEAQHLYFMNTDRGRRAVESLARGDWTPGLDNAPVGLIRERPNIFVLYEENIGPLTPLLSDILKDAEQTYPPEWVAEAVQVAVERNIRNWRYVESILKRWYSEGKDGPIRSNAQKDRGASGKFDDYERFWDKQEKPGRDQP